MGQIKEDNSGRIDEIINELNACREDERSSQNLIIQVVYIASAVIGVIFGFTFVNQNINELALLLLNEAVFCTAFSFIVPLGIENVLRYHYIQDLEDRLGVLVPGGLDKSVFMHWMSFSAPVTTRNPRNLKSKYTWMHFVFYAIAPASAIAFCIGVIFYQYTHFNEIKYWWKILVLIFPSIFVLAALFIFFYSCLNAKKMYEFALRESTEKRKERFRQKGYFMRYTIEMQDSPCRKTKNKKEKTNKKRLQYLKAVFYFIYPKFKDIQKMFLVVAGYVTGLFLMNGFKIFQLLIENFYDIVYILFVTEVLIYQARYQWNDIRGLTEDMKANKTDRLPIEIMGKLRAVVVSSIIICARIGIAFGIVLYLSNNKKIPPLTCMILNLIITVFYEYFRSVKCHIGIFIVVALGYPLRLFTGIWYAYPEFWKNNTIIGDESLKLKRGG